ncbi:MAG: hypothetical protein ACT4OZ_07295 [Gemmatimonadota bacterium]
MTAFSVTASSAATLATEEVTITCPAEIPANGILNTHWVDQYLGGDRIPFEAVHYEYKRGIATSGTSWYWPDPRFTDWGGFRYEWMNPGVQFSCRRVFFPPISFDVYVKGLIEGYALVLPDASGPSDPEEEWRGGSGYFGGAGRSVEEECYEVWIVWKALTGEVILEEYIGDVCFQHGHMT